MTHIHVTSIWACEDMCSLPAARSCKGILLFMQCLCRCIHESAILAHYTSLNWNPYEGIWSVSRKPKVCSTTIYLYAWLLLLCCCAGSAGLSRKGSYRYPVSPRLRAKYIKFSYDTRFEFPSEMNVEFKVIFFTKIMWQRKNSAACRTGIKWNG